jgi:multicomponent Na+:H+ antiporter subunit E
VTTSPLARFRSADVVGWLGRLALFAILWWIIAEGRGGGWAVAAVAVVGSTWASLLLLPVGSGGISPIRLARFLPYFLQQAILGGVDVVRRALLPGGRVDPVLIEFPLRVRDGARVLFTNIVSLVPGTVAVELLEDRLRVHVIDAALPSQEKLRELEARIAAITGSELEDD